MLREIFSQMYKQIIIMRTWPGEVANILVYPFIGLLSLGLFGTFVIEGGVTSEAFIFIIYGVLSWNFYVESQQTLTRGTLYELWNGSLKNLFVTKLGIKQFLFGNMISALINTTAVFLLLTLFTILFFGFNILISGSLMIIGFFGIILHAFSESLIILSLIFKRGHKFMSLAWIMPGIMLVISGVYYPVDMFPAPVRFISNLLPTTHAISGIRSLVLNPQIATGELLTSVGLGLIYITATLLLFRHAFRSSKKDGSLVTLVDR